MGRCQREVQRKKQIPRGNDRKKSKGKGFDAKGEKGSAKFATQGGDVKRIGVERDGEAGWRR